MNNSWLLVCDNYDNPHLGRRSDAADSDGFDIRKYLPETNTGAVIVTTRSSAVKLRPMIRLEKLENIDDCLKIFMGVLKMTNSFIIPTPLNLYSVSRMWSTTGGTTFRPPSIHSLRLKYA